MGIEVQGVTKWVGEALQVVEDREEAAASPLRKVTVRMSSEQLALLDYVAGKLKTSRTGLAEELLARAVEEAVAVVGLPGEEDGFILELAESVEDGMRGGGMGVEA